MERQVAIRTPLPSAKPPSIEATPPPAYSSRGARVLGEQAYTSAMATLIEQHYFPDLRRLAAENAYLDAVSIGDVRSVHEAAQRLVRAEELSGRIPPTPQRARAGTPKAFDHRALSATPRSPFQSTCATPSIRSFPGDTPQPGDESRDREEEERLGDERTTPLSSAELDDLTLDQFSKRFTSADNVSFSELIDRSNQERRHKYAWAFVEEHRQKRKFLTARGEEQDHASKGCRMALPPGEAPRAIASSANLDLAKDLEKPSQQLYAIDFKGSDPSTTGPASAVPDRTTPASWPFVARNSLMFAPRGIPVSSQPSSGPRPSIARNNTRLPEPELDKDKEEDLSTGSVLGLTPISATPRTVFSDDTTGPDDSRSSYPFLSPIPEPEPGAAGSSRFQQLLAWSAQRDPQASGSAPLDAVQETELERKAEPAGFVLPPASRREQLAHRLSRSSATPQTHLQSPRRHRAHRTPYQPLSPAGRSLLQRATDRTASPLARSLLGPRSSASTGRRVPGNQRWTPVTKRS